MVIARSDITGVILAGGLSRRLNGVPKALIELGGQPLLAHVFAAFSPQVGTVLINANDRFADFQSFAVPVIADALPGHRGPLAGIVTAMAFATTSHLAIAPCDSPFLPSDLVSRLAAALNARGGRIAVAAVADRWQPVFALLACDLRDELNAFLASGGSKIDLWYRGKDACVVDFSDERESFLNINTAEDLQAAAARYTQTNECQKNIVECSEPLFGAFRKDS